MTLAVVDVDPAVEEIIRWASPVNYMARTATADVTLHRQMIRRGDRGQGTPLRVLAP